MFFHQGYHLTDYWLVAQVIDHDQFSNWAVWISQCKCPTSFALYIAWNNVQPKAEGCHMMGKRGWHAIFSLFLRVCGPVCKSFFIIIIINYILMSSFSMAHFSRRLFFKLSSLRLVCQTFSKNEESSRELSEKEYWKIIWVQISVTYQGYVWHWVEYLRDSSECASDIRSINMLIVRTTTLVAWHCYRFGLPVWLFYIHLQTDVLSFVACLYGPYGLQSFIITCLVLDCSVFLLPFCCLSVCLSVFPCWRFSSHFLCHLSSRPRCLFKAQSVNESWCGFATVYMIAVIHCCVWHACQFSVLFSTCLSTYLSLTSLWL